MEHANWQNMVHGTWGPTGSKKKRRKSEPRCSININHAVMIVSIIYSSSHRPSLKVGPLWTRLCPGQIGLSNMRGFVELTMVSARETCQLQPISIFNPGPNGAEKWNKWHKKHTLYLSMMIKHDFCFFLVHSTSIRAPFKVNPVWPQFNFSHC